MMAAKQSEQLIRRDGEAVNITWASGRSTVLPNLWLRDNCGCAECRVEQTDEKKFLVSSVPVDLEPVAVTLVDDRLHVSWPDGHISVFNGDELRAFGAAQRNSRRTWPEGFQPRRCDYNAFLSDDGIAADALDVFLADGVMIIDAAPTVPGTLEELAPRLGPVREVLFDRIHNVTVDPSGYNVAHTPMALPPHNDFASYTWPPSVQALHMLANETVGGESIIVDGWAVLQAFREQRPDDFAVLREVPVPFREFDENTETFAAEPIIRCDANDEIAGLRFSNQLMQAIDPNDPRAVPFYRAYHALCRQLTDPASCVSFRLDAGQVLVVAAHRVLHGRMAFEPGGRRHLQDAYFELDNARNHLVVLRKKRRSLP